MTPDAIARAEAATLGAFLVQPRSMPAVSWLRSSDFADPWHARVHQLLRHHTPEQVSALALGEWLMTTYPPQQAELPRVADLLEAAPLRPDPVVYARMVLEASIRREQPAYGLLLRGGALQAALTRSAHPMRAAATLAEQSIAAAENRWVQAHQAPGDYRPDPAAVRVADALLGADRFLAAHGDLDPDTVRDHEQDLIANLITHPHAIPTVTAWLDPATLTDRAWRATYQAITDLTAAGERVDEVTVLWRTAQLSRANGPGPSPVELRATVDAVSAHDPAWTAQTVAGDQLRGLADRASTALRANAANPGLTVPDLLHSAHLHATALTDLADTALPQQPVGEAVEQLPSPRVPALAVRGWAG